MSRLAGRLRPWAIGLLWLAIGGVATAAADPRATAPIEITRAEAVRAGWDSVAPPSTGWTPVELMDFWDARWPGHDGVVWYRMHWRQRGASHPMALLVDYVCLASAVYVNGSLVARDPQLVEPLSRSWIKPQYFLLDAPLLHEGENTLLVRVSGLAAYQPGFGTVTVGDPEVVRARYERGLFQRFHIKLINFAMAAVLGVIFLLIWLLRRQDTFFGWFALSQLTSSLQGYNHVASSPWPFTGTDAWQAFNGAMFMAAGASYAMFLLRYGERRYPRVERSMGVVVAIAFSVALFTPAWGGHHRNLGYALGGAFYYLGVGWFWWRALRTPRIDYRVLGLCLLIPMAASINDFAMLFGWTKGDTYLFSLTSVLTLAGMAFALAYRFVTAMRRVESFNVELQREVAAATTQLGDMLAREHALALANTRASERLQLTRDLHDGFGGTLVGTIAHLEQAPEGMSKARVVALLKEMRDDLRLVVDSTARDHGDLNDLIAPLRHRSAQLLEAVDIDSRWHLDGLDGVDLGGARNLDLLRLLQEALTNVFKHSGATRVDVHLHREDNQLRVRVQDDGRGLQGDAPVRANGGGAGFASMRLRAQRLGGALQVDSRPGRTSLRVVVPLALPA